MQTNKLKKLFKEKILRIEDSNEKQKIVNPLKVKSNLDYLKSFGWDASNPKNSLKYDSTSRLAKAYEVALDIRKFEIELYWKRSTNFWLLVTAISTALGLLASTNNSASNAISILSASQKELGCLILAMAGNMLCIGWFLGNKASKFWQRNWESQVDILEQEVVGPLYKTVIFSDKNFATTSYFSVSDVNKSASCYLAWIFFFISMHFLGLANMLAMIESWVTSKNVESVYELNSEKFFILIFNIFFAVYFYRKNEIKTTDHKSLIDVKLEASMRQVQLEQIQVSKEGEKNLNPGYAGFLDRESAQKPDFDQPNAKSKFKPKFE